MVVSLWNLSTISPPDIPPLSNATKEILFACRACMTTSLLASCEWNGMTNRAYYVDCRTNLRKQHDGQSCL
jgi:hypothetical protein